MSRLAVSNIAWPADRRAEAYGCLAARGVAGLEIAPGLFFAGCADPFAPSTAELAAAMAEVDAAGLTLVSMQSLLYGVEGAALFEGPEALRRLETGLLRAIDLAGRLGLRTLVFGSPKQRVVPADWTPERARDHAAEVFARLGARAAGAGCVIAVEANPAAYGTNFLTHAEDALDFVRLVDHPGVGLILDLGERHLNDARDAAPALATAAGPLLAHVHVSEPYLAPAPAEPAQASPLLAALSAARYPYWVSIEMKAAEPDPVAAVDAAIVRLLAAQPAGAPA